MTFQKKKPVIKEGSKKDEGESTPEVTPQVMEILMLCEKTVGRHYIQAKLGLKDSSGLLCPPLTIKSFFGPIFYPAITLSDVESLGDDSLFY